MLVKDLISLFNTDIKYTIISTDNPHYTIWWGKGNNPNTIVNDKIIKGIGYNAKKGIIIYI